MPGECNTIADNDTLVADKAHSEEDSSAVNVEKDQSFLVAEYQVLENALASEEESLDRMITMFISVLSAGGVGLFGAYQLSTGSGSGSGVSDFYAWAAGILLAMRSFGFIVLQRLNRRHGIYWEHARAINALKSYFATLQAETAGHLYYLIRDDKYFIPSGGTPTVNRSRRSWLSPPSSHHTWVVRLNTALTFLFTLFLVAFFVSNAASSYLEWLVESTRWSLLSRYPNWVVAILIASGMATLDYIRQNAKSREWIGGYLDDGRQTIQERMTRMKSSKTSP